MKRWVDLGVVADNLIRLGQAIDKLSCSPR
jgi:hypothetical protein